MILLNYTYRIYPDQKQVELLNEWLKTCRSAYNYALRELKDWIASRKCPIDKCSLDSEYIMNADYPFPGYQQQQNNLPKAKKEFPRLAAVPSQVLQTTIRRLHDAWDFFQNRGYGFPRFKKYGQMKSMLFPQFKVNPITGWLLKLPKLGKVQINLHRPIPEGFIVKQVRILKKAMGWFAVITIQSDISIPEPLPHRHFVGVDVGLDKYLATSDGFVEPGRKFFQTEHSRLKVLQRRLSKKKKRSANYEKARIKVEKQHNHIAFRRKDYQFKLAHQLCNMAETIFVEDIDFRTMAKGFLGKHTVDAGFGQFRSILFYVGKQRGVYVAQVDHKGTSQTCPNCRSLVRKELSNRWHSCPECKYEADRDVASAQEICNRGYEQLSTQGLWGQEMGCQVGLSGTFCLDKWRRAAMSNSDVGSSRCTS
ncbi:MAG: transposase [Okeania sp. SIO3B5]|uniref:RNA-guided endonuclease InsQ/TnpB family protein n=1 Tax=Okeania sp. SIO3B5 TaxID=2607811 RepID=UPI0014018012|nr:transposase [Okeania sp. SIO3B5]NEO52915.1 transposase [Okeania sp. SIO3B5]